MTVVDLTKYMEIAIFYKILGYRDIGTLISMEFDPIWTAFDF